MEGTSSKSDLQKEKEECEKAAKDAFNRILAAYRQVIDGISEDCFEEVNSIVAKETKKKLDRAGSAFREHLFGLIKDKFTKTWKDSEMDLSVAMLEMAKRNYVVNEKWRPTLKTAEEQLRPHLGTVLTKNRDMMRKEVAEQNEKIAKLIPCIEESRRNLKARMQKKSNMAIEMEKDTKRMGESSKQADALLDKLTNNEEVKLSTNPLL